MCQEMQELPGKGSGKETLGRQCWSPSDRQVSGLGTSSPGENVRKQRSDAGPLERRVTGTPVWDNSERHPSQATGAPIT